MKVYKGTDKNMKCRGMQYKSVSYTHLTLPTKA